MSTTLFSIDGVTFSHLRILELTQTFEILDGANSGRFLSGIMKRDIIGTYFNYKLKIKPEYTIDGMKEYNKLWSLCSSLSQSHVIIMPFDVGDNVTQSTITFNAYITSGSRDMLKYDVNGTNYWKDGDFQFVAMEPKFS